MQTAFETMNKKTGAILHCHDLVELPAPSTPSLAGSISLSHLSNKSQKTLPSNEKSDVTPNSSLSSPSQIDRISLSAVKDTSDSFSDKYNASPVLLDQSSSPSEAGEMVQRLNDTISTCSSEHTFDESYEPSEQEQNIYEQKAQILINKLRHELESCKMEATLKQFGVIKSYAPRINHVVFDIEIRPSKSSE